MRTIPGATSSDCATSGRWPPARLTTIVATALLPYFDLANIVMLFLLTVVLVAVQFGRGPAVLAAFVSVAAFDFFCVPPRLSFAVTDAQYLLTFAVMLAVALIIGQLTAGPALPGARSRRIARSARARSTSSRATCRACLQTEQVVETTANVIAGTFRAKVAVLRARTTRRASRDSHDDGGRAPRGSSAPRSGPTTSRSRPGSAPTPSPGSEFLYLPLRGADAHARRAGDPAGESPAAARSRAAPPARHVRRPCRHRAGARPLRRSGPAGAGRDGVGAVAQFAALGALARPANAARRADRPRRVARAHAARAVRHAARDGRRRSSTRRAG